jgi:ubiquinone/menaquinone biosynthesis C-methylase UbiE
MKNILDVLFVRSEHVCPWWCCFTFDNPVRRLFHNPARIVSPYIRQGSTVIDIGPGMGYFTGAMCKLVGKKGRVIALDIQQRMLDALKKRVTRQGLSDRLKTHLAGPRQFGVHDKADFILAFWMVHEVPDKPEFFKQVAHLMKPGGKFLLAEPYLHVTKKGFSDTVRAATGAGLKVRETPSIFFSRTALFGLS